MIGVNDKVSFGLLNGIVKKIYTLKGEEWAMVDFDGELTAIRLEQLAKVRDEF